MALRIISVLVAFTVFIAYSSVFVVDERQKALVLQFGQVSDVKEDPGLAFKTPFKHFKTLDLKDKFAAKINQMENYPTFGIPRKYGDYYYFTYNKGLENYSKLYKIKEKNKLIFSLDQHNNDPLKVANIFMDQGKLSKDGSPAKIDKES